VIRRAALLVALTLVAISCSGNDTSDEKAAVSTTSTTAPKPIYGGFTSAVYAKPASWLCRPDKDDVCDTDMDADVIEADGSSTVEHFALAKDPKIDCFYVYPTISRDPDANSDMNPGADEELFVVRQQAARFGSVCKVYAPVYRSTTLTALTARLGGKTLPGAADSSAVAYGDVLDAWKQYIDNDNHGRGVIIIGHSQGSGMLGRLLREEIDPKPAVRKLLVSAMLMGTSAHPSDTPNVPPCTVAAQTGCLVSYSSFRVDKPPPAGSFFARPKGTEAAVCTNPAALDGSAAPLHSYFGATGAGVLGGTGDIQWGGDVTTKFVTLPGLVTAQCVTTNGFSYLALTVHPDPGPRVDDVRGDLTPEWGMHLIDVNVAMGDLVTLAETQAEAYVG
jgi:hypothetical protein